MKTWQHTSLLLLLVNRRFKPHPLVSPPPSLPSNLLSPLPSCVTKGLLHLSPASDSYYSIQTHLQFFHIVSYSCHRYYICNMFHNSTSLCEKSNSSLSNIFYEHYLMNSIQEIKFHCQVNMCSLITLCIT